MPSIPPRRERPGWGPASGCNASGAKPAQSGQRAQRGGAPVGAMHASDPRYCFAYDASAGGVSGWRQVAGFRASDAEPKEVFMPHAAGLGGGGFEPSA